VVDDALDLDDARGVLLRPSAALRTLLVDGEPHPSRDRDEVGFLARALEATPHDDGGIAFRIVDPDAFAPSALEEIDVVVLANVATLRPRDAESLRRFVEAGGGLLVAVGERVEPRVLRAQLPWLPASPRAARALPEITTLRSVGRLPTLDARVSRLVTLEPALGAEVLVDPAFSRRGAWAPEHAAPAPAAPPRGRRLPFAPTSTPGPETGAHAEHAHAGLRTVALPTPEPVSVRRLALWLEMIARFHGDHLLRAKALLRDAESGEVWCLHAVQHAVNPPERVAALEDLPPEALGLVLISVGAERGVFESLVASARAIALPPSVPS